MQKTQLVFPFVGPGIVTQAGVTNGGHANRSGQFAIDVVGLSEAYAVYGAPTTRRVTLPSTPRNSRAAATPATTSSSATATASSA